MMDQIREILRECFVAAGLRNTVLAPMNAAARQPSFSRLWMSHETARRSHWNPCATGSVALRPCAL
jgi:hypothetical protein